MPKNTQKLREIEFFNPILKEYVKTTGFYPDNWICAHPKCIRTTKGKQRVPGKDGGYYCSHTCRGDHHTRKRWEKKKMVDQKIIQEVSE